MSVNHDEHDGQEDLDAEVGDLASAATSGDEDVFQAQRTQVITTEQLEALEREEAEEAGAAAPAASPEAVDGVIPGRAHEALEIRTPIQEFESYVRARIETLTRLGEKEQVDVMLQALELGKRKLARITGSSLS